MKIPHQKRDLFIPATFLISIVLCIICFMSHSSGTSTFLSNGLSMITSPLSNATKFVYDGFASIGGYFSDIDELRKENKQLEKENKLLSEENHSLQLLQNENDSLYKFLELKKEHNDYKFINSNIISKSVSGYSSSFTIDKGSFHGVEAGMPIISDAGALVGITYSVDPLSTRCKSILSYDLNVGVYNEATGETGILSGSFDTFLDSKCIIGPLGEDSQMKKGDKILTSGLGETYPRNLIVGTIDSFITDKGSHSQNAVINPDESIFEADYVMVITSFEKTYE